jgi:hypothetical protein
LPTMPAPMMTTRWRAGSGLDSVAAMPLIYQMQVRNAQPRGRGGDTVDQVRDRDGAD